MMIALVGCSAPPTLSVTNNFNLPVYIQCASLDGVDTTRYLVEANQNASMTIPILGSSSKLGDLEFRSIALITANGKTLQVLRFSVSYLQLKQWKLPLPLQFVDTLDQARRAMSMHDLLRSGWLYHYAQELYNGGQYERCLALMDYAINQIAVDTRTSAQDQFYRSINDRENAFYNGYILLGYLSAKKSKNASAEALYWSTIEKHIPYIAKKFKENDIEFTVENQR